MNNLINSKIFILNIITLVKPKGVLFIVKLDSNAAALAQQLLKLFDVGFLGLLRFREIHSLRQTVVI